MWKIEHNLHEQFILALLITSKHGIEGVTLITLINTLRELIFAGTNFCGFEPKPQNLVPAKFFKSEKQWSNNSQNGSNFLSSEKSAKLSSRKKSQNCCSLKVQQKKKIS